MPDPGATSSPPSRVWRRAAIAGGAGMLVGMGLGRFSYTAMVPALVVAGQLDAIDAGLVGTANLGGFLLGALASVRLATRFERTRVLMAAVLLMALLLALSAIPLGFLWLAVCRGLIGIATAIVMVLGLALSSELAPADSRPVAAGYIFAGVGCGILFSATVIPALAGRSIAAAWLATAGAGLVSALVAARCWSDVARATDSARATTRPSAEAVAAVEMPPLHALEEPALRRLLLAHALFSLGIVPHTLYWVDFIARGTGAGLHVAGLHWATVGVLAIIGPMATAELARRLGTRRALIVAFAVLGLGIFVPALTAAGLILVASSVIFGAQPGLSSLMAARARDIGNPAAMNRVMRAMILANATGGIVGGLLVPLLYHAFGDQRPLFLIGGLAMWAAALTVATRGGRQAASVSSSG